MNLLLDVDLESRRGLSKVIGLRLGSVALLGLIVGLLLVGLFVGLRDGSWLGSDVITIGVGLLLDDGLVDGLTLIVGSSETEGDSLGGREVATDGF